MLTHSKSQKTLNVGQAVRISKVKRTFEKAYYQNYTDEIFYIAQVMKSTKPVTYRLVDASGEMIQGIFYRQELSLVVQDKNIYAVEKILQRRRQKDGEYLLVKWQGYPESQNLWIRSKDFISIKQAS